VNKRVFSIVVRFVLLLILSIGVFGVLMPFLFSAKDTILVIAGICLLLFAVPVYYTIITNLTKQIRRTL
jgi:hypothetical protein